MMAKFGKILGITVSIAFVLLGFYVLFGTRFEYLTKQIRVVFAVFLFLYGGWKLTRYILKNPNSDTD
jgi:hypothetical protein